MIRKLIIILCVIFYSSSLVIVVAALNIRSASEGEVIGKLIESDSLPADSSDRIVVLDAVPTTSGERAAQTEEEGLAGADQSAKNRKSILLATLGQGMFQPGQGIGNMDLSQAVLKHLPTLINAIPEYNILIGGHTDSLPIKDPSNRKFTSNKELSFMRAEATASILEGEAVPGKAIIIKGYGDEHPIASNATPEGRARNRRIEMWLVPVNQASGYNE